MQATYKVMQGWVEPLLLHAPKTKITKYWKLEMKHNKLKPKRLSWACYKDVDFNTNIY